jgi:hypothetical protein
MFVEINPFYYTTSTNPHALYKETVLNMSLEKVIEKFEKLPFSNIVDKDGDFVRIVFMKRSVHN